MLEPCWFTVAEPTISAQPTVCTEPAKIEPEPVSEMDPPVIDPVPVEVLQ